MAPNHVKLQIFIVYKTFTVGIKTGKQEWPDLVCGHFIEVFYTQPPV